MFVCFNYFILFLISFDFFYMNSINYNSNAMFSRLGNEKILYLNM